MDLGFDEFSEDEIRLLPPGADDEFCAGDLAGGDVGEGLSELGGFGKGFGGDFDPDEDAGGAAVVGSSSTLSRTRSGGGSVATISASAIPPVPTRYRNGLRAGSSVAPSPTSSPAASAPNA